MESANILHADILDIIFDNRNKEYGAYDLRKHYKERLTKALIIISLLVVLICLTYVLFGSIKKTDTKLLAGPDVILASVKPPPEVKPIVIPPPPPPLPSRVIKMLDFTTPPIIEKNPPRDEMLPEQTDMDKTQIGTGNVLNGIDEDGIDRPVAESKGVVDAPKKIEDDGNKIFKKVEIESEYPGGAREWFKFLTKNLQYSQEAIDQEKEGTVVIQFIVDKEGNVSDVTAISGPEELRAGAIAAIKKSGKWTAAIQNGIKVSSYKMQPITFKLPVEQ